MYQLTIIIPHYNSVDSLEKLLKSIPNNKDIETIIIDDKSTKKMNKLNFLIKKYRDENVTFLNNTTSKKGAGVCRNLGLDCARGRWVLFADSDDFFVESFYKKLYPYFSSDADIIYFVPTSIDNHTGKKSDRHLHYEQIVKQFDKKPNKFNENYLRYKFYVPWSKLIKRNLIQEKKIKFDEVVASNDIMFSTKIGYYAKKIEATTDVIYCVTREKGSLTTQVSKEVFNARLQVWISYYTFLKQKLNSAEFSNLNLKSGGQGFLVRAIKYKFNFQEVFEVYQKLNRNKIPIFEKKFVNPLRILNFLYCQLKLK